MLPSVLIIDDYLKDPYVARKEALSLHYDPKRNHGNYAGLLSDKALDIKGLSASVSRLINSQLKPMPNTVHGHCRITLKGDKGRSGVHIDPSVYSGILFLSLPEHCKGGTDFYRHRRTGLESVPTKPTELIASGYTDPNDLIEDVINKDTLSASKWERTMRVPMRFNRLLLFSPWLFHNAGPGFGERPETGRLVNLMFFGPSSTP